MVALAVRIAIIISTPDEWTPEERKEGEQDRLTGGQPSLTAPRAARYRVEFLAAQGDVEPARRMEVTGLIGIRAIFREAVRLLQRRSLELEPPRAPTRSDLPHGMALDERGRPKIDPNINR